MDRLYNYQRSSWANCRETGPGVVDRRKKIDLEKILVGQVIPTFFNDFDTAMAVLNISLTKMEEAASFGATILARAAFTATTPKSAASDFEIEITPISSLPLPSLHDYIAEFDRLIRR